jgi:hypothetical protein
MVSHTVGTIRISNIKIVERASFMALSTIFIFDILIVPTVWDIIYGSFYDFNI